MSFWKVDLYFVASYIRLQVTLDSILFSQLTIIETLQVKACLFCSPTDLANVVPAAIHNMFTNVLKWHEKYTATAL